MKTHFFKVVFITIISVRFFTVLSYAQCGAGYTTAAINFDLQYLEPTALPSSPLYYTIGKNSMRLAWSGGTNNILNGVNSTHTGSSGSFGSGNDINFSIRNGADTLVFDKEVSNVQFSVYDLDNNQVMNVTAYNAAGTAQNITLARVNGTSITISGSGTTSATATASSSTLSNSSTNAVANISISSAVKRVVLTFTKSTSGTDPIWISDISVCNNNTTTGTWPNGYQAISTPEIGQPNHIIASFGDSIVAINITTNTTTLIYEVGNSNLIQGSSPSINSLAYDPYKQIVYFCDNARTDTNRRIYKYDVKTGIKSTWIADVTAYGMQLFSYGLGSGGGSYYDGALYIGQDASNASDATTAPVTIYRIDIDSTTGNPIRASRFWSKVGYDESSDDRYYDWADFVINNGVLYNFNTANELANNTGLEHINMNSQSVSNGYSPSAVVDGAQCSIDYNGNIYLMVTNNYSLYNNSGGFGSSISYTGTGSTTLTDAAESFKFPYDYGDAPTSYGIAYHLFSTTTTLKIGALVDYEVQNSSNSTASADDVKNTGVANDEEGVGSFPLLTVANASYTVPVSITNSSGATATLYGYIDFNRDGDFNDAGEKSAAASVPNGTTAASPINVTFSGLTGGSVGSSFIRFRLASSASEAGNVSGYAASGEDEDYPIAINASTLPVELVTFTAIANENNTAQLYWTTASELNNDYFEVQRSQSNHWETIGNIDGNGNSNHVINYSFTDNTPYEGINYYRLKQVDFSGKTEYSSVISVKFDEPIKDKDDKGDVVFPNPAKNDIWIKSQQEYTNEDALNLEVYNLTGEKIFASKMQGSLQKIDLSEYQKGMYLIKIGTDTYRIIKE